MLSRKKTLIFVEPKSFESEKNECQMKEEELLSKNFIKDMWSNDSTECFKVKLPWKATLSNNREQAIA